MIARYVRLANWIESWSDRIAEKRGGQGLVEYALLLVLIAVVAIVAVEGLGQQVTTIFQDITANITPA